MSLLLASVRPRDILVSSDSRCVTTEGAEVKQVDDKFQKIFPIPDHPVVIAEMGENRFDNLPLGEFIGRFTSSLNTGDLTIPEIADRLREYAHRSIRARLREVQGGPKTGCNLWVAGFSMMEPGPKMIEIFWQWREEAFVAEERQFPPVSVVAGGTGREQIEPLDWRGVAGKEVSEVQDYQQGLLRKAIEAKVSGKVNTVGGPLQEVLITSAEWRWTLPPPEK